VIELQRGREQREVEIRFDDTFIQNLVDKGLFEMLKGYLLHDLAQQLLAQDLISQEMARKIEG
jgi:hypothetical protein